MFQLFDPFTEMDRLASTLAGRSGLPVPIDAYRSGEHVVVHLDLPGVDPGSINVTVEQGVLTVQADRSARTDDTVQWLARERFTGKIEKQLMLGDALDSDTLTATYDAGVLTLTVAIAQRAKARTVPVQVNAAHSETVPSGDQSQATITA